MSSTAQSANSSIVSVDNNGVLGNGNSFDARVSADGRYVLFSSDANNLSANDNNGATDVFLHDLQNNTTVLISLNSVGNGPANNNSFNPSISSDANVVSFESFATDLVPTDGNNSGDIFVRNLQNNTITLVSINSAGTDTGSNNSFSASISGDGRYVIFASQANDLINDDLNSATDIFMRDLLNDATTILTVNSAGTGLANSSSANPSISADGRFVVFESNASNLVALDNNSSSDVFMRDLQNNTTSLLSINSGGTGSANGGSSNPSISADGRFVTFSSIATDLTSNNDSNGVLDIFVRDTQSNVTTLVSINSAGTGPANSGSLRPDISADGNFIVFDSLASDLAPQDNNGATDIYIRDIINSSTALVSVNADASGAANNSSFNPSVSADGGLVIYHSNASNLVLGDTNVARDVFATSLLLEDSGPIVTSTLPASRSVQVNQTATAFATIINSATTNAVDCSITPSTPVNAIFSYQATDMMNMPSGNVDTPVDIAGGATQNFVISFMPTAAFIPTTVAFTFDCLNTDAATSTVGLNTLLLSADNAPVADVVALTTVVDLQTTIANTALFAVGSANVGASSDITVSLDDGGQGLPLTMSVCQTDVAGVCMATPSPSVNLNYVGATTASFAVFIETTADITNDPANNRIFIRFTDSGGIVRGATSTAVRTQ